MKVSWAGRLFTAAAVLSGYKRFYSHEKVLSGYMAYRKKANDKPHRVPFFSGKAGKADKRSARGMETFVLENANSEGRIVLYLHGSGYVMQPTAFHWRFFGRLAKTLKAEIVMPIYPKAPAHHFGEALEKLAACYAELLKRTDARRIVFVGDSSGGAVALALTQEIIRRRMPAPARLILISPMLDSVLNEPGVEALERKDLLQTRKVLRRFGQAWAGDQSLAHPGVSPLYGSRESLPPVSLFIGTHDILLACARAFAARFRSEGGDIELFEYEKMVHDFVLLPVPEARDAIGKIAERCEVGNLSSGGSH